MNPISRIAPVTDAEAARMVHPDTLTDLAERLTSMPVAAAAVAENAAGSGTWHSPRRTPRRLLIAIPAVAALAVTALLVTSLGRPGQRIGSGHPPPPPPKVTFATTINGKSAAPRKDGHVLSYPVRPGEHLVMRVTVTVPVHVRVTAVWFGISRGVIGTLSNLRPLLARTRKPLIPGLHTFRLGWTVPAGLRLPSGLSLYLVATWRYSQGMVAQTIAQLTAPSRPSGLGALILPIPRR